MKPCESYFEGLLDRQEQTINQTKAKLQEQKRELENIRIRYIKWLDSKLKEKGGEC